MVKIQQPLPTWEEPGNNFLLLYRTSNAQTSIEEVLHNPDSAIAPVEVV